MSKATAIFVLLMVAMLVAQLGQIRGFSDGH